MSAEVYLEPSLSSDIFWINFILVSAFCVAAKMAIVISRLSLFSHLVLREKRKFISAKFSLQKFQGRPFLAQTESHAYSWLNYRGQWDEVIWVLWLTIPRPHIHHWTQPRFVLSYGYLRILGSLGMVLPKEEILSKRK